MATTSHDMLVRVEAPHFCAGIVLEMGVVVRAAPILKWTLSRDAAWLRSYFKRKGWRASVLKC